MSLLAFANLCVSLTIRHIVLHKHTHRMDYHHNFSDINAGAFIGVISALVGYFALYPSLVSRPMGSGSLGGPHVDESLHVVFDPDAHAHAHAHGAHAPAPAPSTHIRSPQSYKAKVKVGSGEDDGLDVV